MDVSVKLKREDTGTKKGRVATQACAIRVGSEQSE